MIKWIYSYLLIIPFVTQVFGQGVIFGLSRWQFVHAVFFAGMLLIAANCFYMTRTKKMFNWNNVWLLGSVIWGGILLHTFWLGDPLSEGLMFFVKIEFWLIFVLLFLVLTETKKHAELFVLLMIMGGCFNAISVIFFYLSGDKLGVTSMYSEVMATAGNAEVSGKATVGIMISAFWMVIYRFRGNVLSPIPCVLLGLLISAVMLTYDRSGQAALGLGMFFLLIHSIRKDHRLLKLLIPLVIFGGILLGTIGSKTLFIRWTDTLYVHDSLGSGRDIMWRTSWLVFRWDFWSFLFGYGVEGMYRIAMLATKIRIHMHSDFFDLMVMAGLPGVLFWFYFMFNLWRSIVHSAVDGIGQVVAYNLLICVGVLSLLTGQMYFPTTMCYQLCSLFAVLMLSDHDFFAKNLQNKETV